MSRLMSANLVSWCILLITSGSSLAQGQPFDGYTLYNNLGSNTTHLVDMNGVDIRTWQCTNGPASTPSLYQDGSIVRPQRINGTPIGGGAVGGLIQIRSWDNVVLWSYTWSNEFHQQHHDVNPLPNGNVLFIAWELKTNAEAIAMGRQSINGNMWPLELIEVKPTGPTSGEIVWEWHIWDHLIQDVDSNKPNYGVVSDHPELMNINFGSIGGGPNSGDWIHANAVDYNPQTDEVIFSSHFLHEVYVIDHSTTTEEAAGHTGGNSGRGGDILYRWGNPMAYERGIGSDQHLFVVHGVTWIDAGSPGEGHILLFNNGDRPGNSNDYSSVEEIIPPRDSDGNYIIEPGEPYGPPSPVWEYADPADFYSNHLSGAFRQPNGNTVITEGTSGFIFEVTESGNVVWELDTPGNLARTPRYPLDYLDSYCAADINGDSEVGFQDLLMLLAGWGECFLCPEDIDDNSAVDFNDLLEILVAWGPCS